jgi:hypothetical protein
MKTTIKQMEALQESLEELIATREGQFEDRSEKWQESEKGEEFMERTDRLQEMLDELIDWQTELGS